jgi:hypothetical protein
LVYTPDDLPTHYGFIVTSKLDSIEREFNEIRESPTADLWSGERGHQVKSSAKLDNEVQLIIDGLDSRGAWVEPGQLHYHGDDDPTTEVIRSETFSKNIQTLASWLAANR